MASLALGFAGEAIGSSIGGTVLGISATSIGGFIGAEVGGMLDNLLTPKGGGPRISDLSVQVSTYGNPIPVLFGPENRVAGNVIWSSGLKPHKKSTGLKGEVLGGLEAGVGVMTGNPMLVLGGVMTAAQGMMSPATYTYSIDVAIALSDCQFRGPIKTVQKVWANKKLIYDKSQGSGPLSDHGGGIGGAIGGLVGFDQHSSNTSWSAFRIYPGDFEQTPDPTIEAEVGVGTTEAYRGTAYIVFADFQLADYNNALPQFEFLVEADEEITVGAVCSAIAAQSGIDPNTVSSGLLSGTVRGFAIGTNSSGTGALQPLALVYDFDVSENSGALRFYPRGAPACAIIEADEFAAHQSTDVRPEAINFARAPETTLPQQASLTYIDPDLAWQPGAQLALRSAGNAQSNLSSEVAIVIDADTARQVADRMLWEAWQARATSTCSVSDRWLSLEPGRSYLIEGPAGLDQFRVKTRTRGANRVMSLELVADRPQTYASIQIGARGTIPVQSLEFPPPTFLQMLDIPILRDADDDTGFYLAVDAESTGWRGADVIRSTDGGTSYDEIAPIGVSSPMGIADGLGAGPTCVIDYANTLRVTLADVEAELVTITLQQMLEGRNVCWVGAESGEDGEVLQFMTATLTAPGVYELSGLLRGRLGTEYAVSAHGSGEVFVLLDGGMLMRPNFSAADWNKTRLYKAVSLLTLPSITNPVTFTNTGEGKRPLSPVHLNGSLDHVSGDLTVNWTRRSRLRQPGLGNGPLPLGEQDEAYEIDIVVGSDIVRTLSSTAPTVLYTASERAADGIGPSDSVQVAVYQMSDARGRGRPLQGTV